MGWFEEQIKLRSEKDGEALDEALKNVSAMIEGKKRRSFSDDREKIKSALDEILAYYGVRPRDIPHDVKEVDDQIEYSCRQSGIMYRSVKLEKGWYRDAAGAMLGRLKSGEVVALLPDKLGRYGFFNPNTQKRVKLNRKTQELFEEDAYCFYKPFPLKKIGIRDLIKYIFSTIDVSVIVYIVAITLFATLVGMITPKITKILFSDVLESKSLQLLLSVACFYVCTSLSLLLIRGIKSLLMNRVSIQMDVSVQAATMARVLSLPPNFFKNYSSGEITSRAQSVNSLCTTLVQTFLSTGLTSLFSLLYITQVFVYAKELVVPALCVTIATLVFSVVSSLVQMKISEKQMELSGKMSGLTYQIITGVQKIKLSGSEKRVFARWLNHYSEEAKLTYNPPKFLLFNGVISTAISLVGTIVMYFFAVQSNVSVADYTAFNSAYGMLSGALMSVAGIALTAARIKPVFEMAKPIMNAEPEISEGKQTVTKISGGIELSHVSFRYDVNSPLVVDDLSLKIRPGQYVAVVG
ncbi:MAG: ABC transporter transmembrane domain-containing protein, partial [Christensenellaceae bacterium]|nr:ABC transporter transmembrane domain-containing protein [Christensenellaceae bacterium]